MTNPIPTLQQLHDRVDSLKRDLQSRVQPEESFDPRQLAELFAGLSDAQGDEIDKLYRIRDSYLQRERHYDLRLDAKDAIYARDLGSIAIAVPLLQSARTFLLASVDETDLQALHSARREALEDVDIALTALGANPYQAPDPVDADKDSTQD